MIFRSITALGDWTFGQGVGGYLTEEQAIEANVRTRLLSWKNDCFWAMGDFVDWFARLDKGQETNLQQELATVILQSYGVVAVTNVSIDLNAQTRNCVITYTMTTIYSQLITQTVNLTAGTPVSS